MKSESSQTPMMKLILIGAVSALASMKMMLELEENGWNVVARGRYMRTV